MSDNPFLALDQRLVGDIYTSREVMDNLTILCDEFGSRFGGTEGERQAAAFLRQRLEQYGLSDARLESFEYQGWRRGTARLEVLAPVRREIPCISLPHSPPVDLEAELLDLGDAPPSAFQQRAEAIKGRVVMASSDPEPAGTRRWIHRGEKYGRSLMAGAAGFIFANHYPAYGPATGGVGHRGAGLIPGLAVNHEDGAFLRRLLRRGGPVRLRLQSTDQIAPMTSWNVLAELPGRVRPDEVVMLGCHYDGHDISQGAQDPASGAAALLEAARVLARHAGQQAITVRFAFWGVEEIGLIGSRHYVAAHEEALDRLRFYLNLDSAGASPDRDIILNEWPDLASLFEKWRDEMALEFAVGQSVNAHSDHFPFLLAGIPTGGLEKSKRSGGRGFGHTSYDTLDKVRLAPLREAAAVAARLALRLANVEPWPARRRRPEEVQALFSDPDYAAEESFRHALAAHYRAAREAEMGPESSD